MIRSSSSSSSRAPVALSATVPAHTIDRMKVWLKNGGEKNIRGEGSVLLCVCSMIVCLWEGGALHTRKQCGKMFSVFSSALVHCRYLASTFFMPLASLVTAVISGRFVSHFFLSFTCCWFLSSIYHAVKSHMCCTALTWFDFNFLPAEFSRLATAKLNEWASEWISKCPHLKAFSSSSTSIELTAGKKEK